MRPLTSGWRRLGLTRQVALLSLIPILALGVALAVVVRAQIVRQELSNATSTAELVARLGIQPRLTPSEVAGGLTATQVAALDQQLRGRSVTKDLARIKIWNANAKIVYSDDHALIGRILHPSDDLESALEGDPGAADVVTPRRGTETQAEVGLGRLVEVYVPIRFGAAAGKPAGAFEIYLSYAPLAAAITRDRNSLLLMIAIGLALLWALLFRIVDRASRTLGRQAAENDRLARYDQLTGLPNARLFVEALTAQIERHGQVATLLVNLDRFKSVNDTLGRGTGDDVLRAAADRLSGACGAHAAVARVGADEFAIALAIEDDNDVSVLVGAIRAALRDPVMLDGFALNVEARIGIAHAPADATQADELMRCASVALDRARSTNARVVRYAEDQAQVTPEGLRLLGEVRGALARREFTLHYQPQIDVRSGRVRAVEALLRWTHPELGPIGPMTFIPAVEQTELIGPVTDFVIDEALRQVAAWNKAGMTIGIAVNLSARNLLNPELAREIAAALERHGVAPSQLTVEVTESAAMVDAQRAIEVLAQLRDAGVSVSVDDFGTGHASIEYLSRLPADELKIDRSYVSQMDTTPRTAAIVRSTVELASNLGLRVVAEGVETQAVLELLASGGCDVAQGYLIAKPLPAHECTEWLAGRLRPVGIGKA